MHAGCMFGFFADGDATLHCRGSVVTNGGNEVTTNEHVNKFTCEKNPCVVNVDFPVVLGSCTFSMTQGDQYA